MTVPRCHGDALLKSLLTSSFKLAYHSVRHLIGRLLSTNRIHGQSQSKCLVTTSLLWPLTPSVTSVTPGSGLESSPPLHRWGWWLGLLWLRYHMWRLCFSNKWLCRHLNQLHETWSLLFSSSWITVTLTVAENLSRLRKHLVENLIKSGFYDLSYLLWWSFFYNLWWFVKIIKDISQKWPNEPLLVCQT